MSKALAESTIAWSTAGRLAPKPMANDQRPTAYYNELDPQKAAWLKELMKAGVIAQGIVDERSIAEVQPADLKGFAQCHFFAGIGVWSYALRLAGWPDDKQAWTGSCPCQPFSISGKRRASQDGRHLWPQWFRLIRESAALACPEFVFGEQVASDDGLAWLDLVSADLEGQDYTVGALDTCAAGFGAPHIRQRLYFCAFASCKGPSSQQTERKSRQAEEHSTGAPSATGECANASGTRQDSFREGTQSEGWTPRAVGGDSPLQRPHAEHAGHDQQTGDAPFAHPDESQVRLPDGSSGNSCNPSRERCGEEGTGSRRPSQWSSNAGEPEYDSNPSSARLSPCQPSQLSGEGRRSEGRATTEPGATNGFWSNADWWYGRDGKYRPIEPRVFPLAHGVTKRVLKLRGYGDAIVAPQAAAFISACFAEVFGTQTQTKNNPDLSGEDCASR